ncbi:MAG: hypothetical protein NC035_03850 [Bacteroides sp.]|nr:hypothetical protein [Bacteroides sp.]
METRCWEINLNTNQPIHIAGQYDLETVMACDLLVIREIGAAQGHGVYQYYSLGAGEIDLWTSLGSGRIIVEYTCICGNQYGDMGFVLNFSVDEETEIYDNLYVSGNVGIGTTSPQAKLHVMGDIRGGESDGGIKIKSNIGYVTIGTQHKKAYFSTDRSTYYYDKKIINKEGIYASDWHKNLQLLTDDISRLTILYTNGNVGIGTATPQYTLDVNGKMQLRTVDEQNGWNYSYLHWTSHSLVMGTPVGNYAHNAVELRPGGVQEEPLFSALRMYTATGVNQHVLRIDLNSEGHCVFDIPGNFGIGTSEPQYKLDVNGTLRAKKILVNVENGADFVFDEGYHLRPLNEVKMFIQENGHLPEIRSAADMQQNGVSINELQIQLLQKIEELTLYILKQDEQIQQLKNEIHELRK